ncbi:enoyl-CoA hydratase, partial [Janibacter sp. RAF20_2_2]
PVAAALALAERLATRSPDALAATKRLFDGTWHRSPRHTFARERREQLPLLFGPNAARARAANARKAEPEFLPRQRRLVP